MEEIIHTYNSSKEIDTKKVNIKKLFTDFWFRIPEYQRSYVWDTEQIDELLDDLNYARNHNSEKEYFLGSVVLQKYKVARNNLTYECCDVLDGQQRLTTLFILMAVLRDLSQNKKLTENAKSAIYQEEDQFSNQPERIRIEFMIRDRVESFVENYIKEDKGTEKIDELSELKNGQNISIAQMAKNMLYLRNQLNEYEINNLNQFAVFLFNKVIFIYVASENLEDAFRLFTILNDRGIPLANSDILKSINIGEVPDEKKRRQFAIQWEQMEGEFGRDEFDRFLGHIRTIVLREKARENLLKEYEKIYREKKLQKGEPTLKTISNYRNHYAKLLWFDEETSTDDFRIRNLITIMKAALASDWIPVLLAYYEKFRMANLYLFLQRLESKFLADWMLQLSPTKRLNNTYGIIREVNKADNADQVILNNKIFNYDREDVKEKIEGDIYGKNFSRYLLLKLEYLLKDHAQTFPDFYKITVEHVLPQNPNKISSWVSDFTEDQRTDWTHKLANLVLISRIKNSKLNNLDFKKKKTRYFEGSINVFPNVNKVMQYDDWTPTVLAKRQSELIELLMDGFK